MDLEKIIKGVSMLKALGRNLPKESLLSISYADELNNIFSTLETESGFDLTDFRIGDKELFYKLFPRSRRGVAKLLFQRKVDGAIEYIESLLASIEPEHSTAGFKTTNENVDGSTEARPDDTPQPEEPKDDGNENE